MANFGKDLRCDPRLPCLGSAEVFLTGDAPPFPARILNLSLGGCLLVVEKQQDLYKDKFIEVTFNVNQLPFRVKGQVRAVRPDCKVGIAFPALSARTRARIEDLVAELSAIASVHA